jgi:magnesium transporter
MDLETELAREALSAHPLEAAAALEQVPAEDAAALLDPLEPAVAASVLQLMATPSSTAIVRCGAPGRAAEWIAALPLDLAAILLRRLEEAPRDAILAALPEGRGRGLRALLGFPEQSAGALMDPEVLALPADLSAGEALDLVRRNPEHARYNLYVVDRAQRLVGVLNLRELLLAEPKAPLSECMREQVYRVGADADRHRIVSDPGWREVHSLPVVDAQGLFLGALRYRTLRRLEEELRGVRPEEGATARALGDLFRTGAAGVFEALAASIPTLPERSDNGP